MGKYPFLYSNVTWLCNYSSKIIYSIGSEPNNAIVDEKIELTEIASILSITYNSLFNNSQPINDIDFYENTISLDY